MENEPYKAILKVDLEYPEQLHYTQEFTVV